MPSADVHPEGLRHARPPGASVRHGVDGQVERGSHPAQPDVAPRPRFVPPATAGLAQVHEGRPGPDPALTLVAEAEASHPHRRPPTGPRTFGQPQVRGPTMCRRRATALIDQPLIGAR
jgi:hypothetical protein